MRTVVICVAGSLVIMPSLPAQEQKKPVVPIPQIPVLPPAPAKPAVPAPAPAPKPAPPPPLPAFPATDLAPDHRPFIKPKVPAPLFTPGNTALLEVECERIASFLARRAAEKYTPAVLRGDREAMSEGRLLLTISLHLAPHNAAAVHCSDSWADGKAPSLPTPHDDLRTFSGFLLMAAQRQAGEPGSAREVLARILTRFAADFDPKNEEAVYASEIQDRAGKAPPLRELLEGTLTVK